MTDAVLALNAGSSSVKFGLFEVAGGREPVLVAGGQVERLNDAPHLVAKDVGANEGVERDWPAGSGDAPLAALLDWVDAHLRGDRLRAAGHRIVHGGPSFLEPVRLTPAVQAELAALTPLAPLHQPGSLAPIEALERLRPGLVQIACFDTAFHHTIEPPASRYAIPAHFEQEGVRRYGFHGLSYEYIAARLAELSPSLPPRRTVAAHLGNGASLCAMREGRSLDTTMGFSALDGLVMGTRPGAIDPGILLYLQQERGFSVADVETLLYRQSGLLGVSGLSSDMRTLTSSDDPRAAAAVELFAFSVSRHVAALANTLGGIECLVFTGGIGEHSAPVRARIAERLAWLGVAIDAEANAAAAPLVSTPESAVEVRIIPANEELTIARHVCRAIGP